MGPVSNLFTTLFQRFKSWTEGFRSMQTNPTLKRLWPLCIGIAKLWPCAKWIIDIISTTTQVECDNYVPQWWVEFDDELSWLITNRLSDTRYMKVNRMAIKEILGRIWLFSASKIKISESISKHPNQLIVELNSSLRHIIVTKALPELSFHNKKCAWSLLWQRQYLRTG